MNTSENLIKNLGQIIYIVGTQWGDEGKGKLVDILSKEYDMIARSAGGANAGHTICFNEEGVAKKFDLHLIPSGILREGKICLIGNGTVVHLPTFFEEINKLNSAGISTAGRIFISDKAHLLMSYHKQIDVLNEEMKQEKKVGTTKKGIGPAYADKICRIGITVGDLYDFDNFAQKLKENIKRHKKSYNIEVNYEEIINYYKDAAEKIQDFIIDTTQFMEEKLLADKKVLIEGAQGTLLDIDHGTYPYVTSSSTTSGGACTGLGIAPKRINKVVGIMKAYCTRVGEGPFPSELPEFEQEFLRKKGHEYGTTTGRPRRCGWLDLVALKKAILINGVDSINLTKLDVLTGLNKIKVVTQYLINNEKIDFFPNQKSQLQKIKPIFVEFEGWSEAIESCKTFSELPKSAQLYVEEIEKRLGVPINFIGVGPNRSEMIYR